MGNKNVSRLSGLPLIKSSSRFENIRQRSVYTGGLQTLYLVNKRTSVLPNQGNCREP